MAMRILKPLVRWGGYYPSKKYTPLVYPGGYTTMNAAIGPLDPLNTFSGDIVRFTTKRGLPMKSLKVSLSPQQDLHGYGSPWPAGGGKNKLQVTATTQTINGVTFTVHDDGTITTNGTADGTIYFDLGGTLDFASATYVLSGCPTGGDGSTFHMYVLPNYSSDVGNGIEFTSTVTGVRILVNSGMNMDGKTFKPMLCLASDSQPRVFAPYSNICPISGWTGCEVYRTGKNLLNLDLSDYWLSTTTGLPEATSYGYSVSDYIKVEDNNPVALSAMGTARRWFYDKYKNPKQYLSYSEEQIFTPPEDGYIRVTVEAQYYDSAYVVYGSSYLEDYEPYNGNSYSVTWEDEVYGANPDIVSGEMPVTYAEVDLGTLEWRLHNNNVVRQSWIGNGIIFKAAPNGNTPINVLCDIAKAVSYNASWGPYVISTNTATTSTGLIFCVEPNKYASGEEFKTAMTGVKLVYERNAPIETAITPTPVSTLKGTNVVWADAGDVIVTAYGTPIVEPDVQPLQAMNLLLGGAYHNNHTPEDVSDEEALNIITGGADR